MKVMVPVGLLPPSRSAVSVNVTDDVPSVTAVGLGVVVIVGPALLIVTCSLVLLMSLAGLLLLSPLYLAYHW